MAPKSDPRIEHCNVRRSLVSFFPFSRLTQALRFPINLVRRSADYVDDVSQHVIESKRVSYIYEDAFFKAV